MSKKQDSGRRLYLPPWSRATILAGAARFGVARTKKLLDALPGLEQDTPLAKDLGAYWHADHGGVGLAYTHVNPRGLVVLGAGIPGVTTTGPVMLWLKELARPGERPTLAAISAVRPLELRAVIGHGVVGGVDPRAMKEKAEAWREAWEKGTRETSPRRAWKIVEFPELNLAALVLTKEEAGLRAFHQWLSSRR